MTEEHLFNLALGLGPAERAALLDRECAGNPALRARVEALLAADANPNFTVDKPVLGTGEYVPTGAEPGAVIAGRYTLVESIGIGGMGEVWVAKQSEPVKRKVALKLIKAGMDTKAVLHRFDAERQALAMMDHPNIAKVLDGGMTAERRPFFVMELVNGLPLTKFCDEAKLGIRERLELFVAICQAVQHAHQKGIIHRDLKPSNILVTLLDGRPIPKIIDFGVAKAVGGRLTEESLSTQFGAVVGTFEYMSPEQAGLSAADVDTRSDIYSLGVTLYELLTGLKPFDADRLRQAAVMEIVRIIKEEEPSKPSTRLSTDASAPSLAALRHTEPKKLAALLRGELDWVVMKCLEKQRDRRYETANGLARDLQRYLADEPVDARPPSAGYKMRKFLRRHKGPVIAASVVLLALVGGIAGTSWGFYREAQARIVADQQTRVALEEKKKAEQAEADTLASYRASTEDAIEKLIGSKPELGPQEKEYLENTLKRWQAFADRQGNDERSQAVRAEGHFRVGWIWAKLSRPEEARREHETSRDIFRKLADAFPDIPAYKRDLARAHGNVAAALQSLGQNQEAHREHKMSRDLYKKLADAFPDIPEYRQNLALGHLNVGYTASFLGHWEEVWPEHETSRDLYKKLADAFPDVAAYRDGLADANFSLGLMLADRGRNEQARPAFETALDLRKKLADAFPTLPAYQNALATTHGSLGLVLADLNLWNQARREYGTSCDLLKKLADSFPAVSRYRVELGATYCNLGLLESDEGRLEESLRLNTLAISTLLPVHEAQPRLETAKVYLCVSYNNRAKDYQRLGQFADAVKDWDRAIAINGENQQASYRASRAPSLIKTGKVDEAIADVAELTTARTWNAAQWYDFARVYAIASGKLADKKQEYADKAMACLQKAVNAGFKDAERMKNDTDLVPLREREDFKKTISGLETKALSALASVGDERAKLLESQGKPAEAATEWRFVIRQHQKLVDDNPTNTAFRAALAKCTVNLALVLSRLGRSDEALATFQNVLPQWERLVADLPDVWDYRLEVAATHANIGAALHFLLRWNEAEPAYRRALKSQELLAAGKPATDESNVNLQVARHNLGELALDRGDNAAAVDWFSQAIAAFTAILNAEPRAAVVRSVLGQSHKFRAIALARLGRFAEAVTDWDAALGLDDGSQRTQLRIGLAEALANADDAGKALTAVDELPVEKPLEGCQLYKLAKVCTIAAAKLPPADGARARAKAEELGRRAIATGFPEVPAMLKGNDLDSYRRRVEYADLLWDLAGG